MISIIVAQSRNRAIGKDNDFPWHLSDDLKNFRKLTIGHPVIMGRGNYDHLIKRIGKILPDRLNIIVTRNRSFKAVGAEVVHSLDEALGLAQKNDSEVFIIGGAQMFEHALPVAERIYLTEVDYEFDGDAYFPALNPNDWTEISREHHPKDEKHQYSFDWVVLDRKS